MKYRITRNFCGVKVLRFWTKKKTFKFCVFFSLRIENFDFGAEKKIVLQEAKTEAMNDSLIMLRYTAPDLV